MAIGTNPPAFQAWVQLARGFHRIQDAVGAALKSAELPPLDWYDVLLELERHGSPMRTRDLEQRLLIAQYNLSRLLDRLENEQFIARQPDPEDGRSRLISITERGLAARSQSWPIYRRAIEGLIGTRLTPLQAMELARLLKRIATS